MPLRAKVATSVSRTAAALSRAAGRGDGSVIGGWIGLQIDPDLLKNLAAGRAIALVSGTNGKTTTTRFTAAALGVLGPVATNSFGANMPTGHTSALAGAGATPYAVLEADEHHLGRVTAAPPPRRGALAAVGGVAHPHPVPARPGQGGGDDGAAVANRPGRASRRARGRQRRRS